MNIYEKLNIIQTTLKAPKGQYNSFGKYKYRSCEDILEAVKPLLKEHKLVLMLTDSIEQIGERIYVKATAKLINTEEERYDQVENTAYAREDENKKGMDGSQVTGASSTYARKYALNGLFCIDDTKDADSQDNRENGQSESVQGIKMKVEGGKLTEQHYNIILKACANAKFDGNAEEFWKNRYKVNNLADIPDEQFEFILTGMKCDRYGNYKG